MPTTLQNRSKAKFEDMLEHLRQIVRVVGTNKARSNWKHSCCEDFILKHGTSHTPRKLPADVKPGKNKQCFMNCLDLAQSRPDLIYVEGYAMGVVPVMHAWCVTKDGFVVDPTWNGGVDRAPLGDFYFGVRLKLRYVMEVAIKSGVSGVIDNYQSGYELLKGVAASEWKA